ncbi:hypothetical protein A0O28_0059510 [Trichoderma guizhouense]|uniref:Uncharacterized protein n=1 Tax=Trichoderma guizhouense TaxID=1491466 RepID=A0A1T3C7A8_9HYPO|nr:hypothetical protein A0O28_0059510 [Trichoderma guizhouense]
MAQLPYRTEVATEPMIFGMGSSIRLGKRHYNSSLEGSGVANHRRQIALPSNQLIMRKLSRLLGNIASVIWSDCYLPNDSFEAFKYESQIAGPG